MSSSPLVVGRSPACLWVTTCVCVYTKSLQSCLTFVPLWTVACQAPLSMEISRQECWSGLPFPSPVDHVLSEVSTMTRPSWVALHGMAYSFFELDRAVVHVIRLVSFLWLWFLSVCPVSKFTADGDCSHEIKRCLLLERKVMANLDSILKSRDTTLPTKVHLVKAIICQ